MAPRTPEELKTAVADLYARSGIRALPSAPNGLSPLPPYTALSARARTILLAAGDNIDALALLDRLGCEIVRYRSWGRNGVVLRGKSERNFQDDHDLMKQPAQCRSSHPRRLVFGLPHNYYFSASRQSEQVGPADNGLDRRASPLLIHVHECGTTPVAMLSFLPAQFLPPPARIDVGGKVVNLTADAQLWGPIEKFLDRLLDSSPAGRKERFGETCEVRP